MWKLGPDVLHNEHSHFSKLTWVKNEPKLENLMIYSKILDQLATYNSNEVFGLEEFFDGDSQHFPWQVS